MNLMLKSDLLKKAAAFLLVAASFFVSTASPGASLVSGADSHPYSGKWYFANPQNGNCNSAGATPKKLVAWLEATRLHELANYFREPRMFAHCSAGVKGRDGDDEKKLYLSSSTNYFSCAVFKAGRYFETYTLYADEGKCIDNLQREILSGGR